MPTDEARMKSDPDCYSCGGTGEIQWSGAVRGQRCPCTYSEYWEESGEGEIISFKRGYMRGYKDAAEDHLPPKSHSPSDYGAGYDEGFELGLQGEPDPVRPAGVSDDFWDGVRDGFEDAQYDDTI